MVRKDFQHQSANPNLFLNKSPYNLNTSSYFTQEGQRQRTREEYITESTNPRNHDSAIKLKRIEDSDNALPFEGQNKTSSNSSHSTQEIYNSPMLVISTLRDRCQQKPHLLVNTFPPKDSNSRGLLKTDDIARGLANMGFTLSPEKVHYVLSIIGLSRALSDGKAITLIQLKTALLNADLEVHQAQEDWKERGRGEIKSVVKGRAFRREAGESAGGKAFYDKLENLGVNTSRQAEAITVSNAEENRNLTLNLTPNTRVMLQKVLTQVPTIRRAFHTIDLNKRGTLSRSELKHVLDSFCMVLQRDEYDSFVNYFDVNKDGVINYEMFLDIVINEISPQLPFDSSEVPIPSPTPNRNSPTKPNAYDMKNRTRPTRNYTTENTAQFSVKTGGLPLSSLEELAIYHRCLTSISRSRATLIDAFYSIDARREGYVSKHELRSVLDNFVGFEGLSAAQVDAVVGLFDRTFDGRVRYMDFLEQVEVSCRRDEGEREEKEKERKVGLTKLQEEEERAVLVVAKQTTIDLARITTIQNQVTTNKLLQQILAKLGEKFATVRRAFMEMDTDRSGYLDKTKLRNVIDNIGYKVTEKEMTDIYSIFDSDGNGQVDYQEFLALLVILNPKEEGGVGKYLADKAVSNGYNGIGRKGIYKQGSHDVWVKPVHGVGETLQFLCDKIHEKWSDIHKSFLMLDWDRSGTVSPSEIRAVLNDYCYTVTDEVFGQLIDIFDADHDGEISYTELLDTLKKVVTGTHPAVHKSRRVKSSITSKLPAERQEQIATLRSEQAERNQAQKTMLSTRPSVPPRFDMQMAEVASLGTAHLYICKIINGNYSTISKALSRIDYDKKHFVTTQELLVAIETYCGRLNPILWLDLLLYFDPMRTGVVDYKAFLEGIREQIDFQGYNGEAKHSTGGNQENTNSNNTSNNTNSSNVKITNPSLKSAFSKGGGPSVSYTHGSAPRGVGAHAGSSADASFEFLCSKIYERFSSIKTAFMNLDADRGGTIGKRELKQVLDDCCYDVSAEVFEGMYKKFDDNGDGEIDYIEFMNQVRTIAAPNEFDNGGGGVGDLMTKSDLMKGNMGKRGVRDIDVKHPPKPMHQSHNGLQALHFLQEKMTEHTESVRTAFRLLDYDQTGSISALELRKVLDDYCYEMNDVEFGELMGMLDINHDGEISYEEFMAEIGSSIAPPMPLKEGHREGVHSEVRSGRRGNGYAVREREEGVQVQAGGGVKPNRQITQIHFG